MVLKTRIVLVLFILLSTFARCPADFFESELNESDLELLITCLIRELINDDGSETWKACIDPDLARTKFDIAITDAPGQNFTYLTTRNEIFRVFNPGNATGNGQGATDVEAVFTSEGLPDDGAIIANSFFTVPTSTNAVSLPTDRVMISQGRDDYNIILDTYASAVRDVSNATDGTTRSPFAYYRLDNDVRIGSVVRNVGTGGVVLDGFFSQEINPNNQDQLLLPGPSDAAGAPLPGFANFNTGMNTAGPGSVMRFPQPNNFPIQEVNLNEFTLSFWLNPGSEIDSNNIAAFQGGGRTMRMDYDSGLVRFLVDNEAPVEAVIEVAAWSHIAAVIDDESGLHQIYINGEKQAEEVAQVFDFELSNFVIGGFAPGASFTIDEFALWNLALDEESIRAHYEAAINPPAITDSCDFDGSGALDLGDIVLLANAIRRGTNDPTFDLNADGLVNFQDLQILVTDESKLHTYMGDANLDGEFNSGDLITVFQPGKYETGATATWNEGDFNGDGLFDSGDLVTAFADGGYELGPRWKGPANAPEPSSSIMLWMGLALIVRFQRHSRI